MKARLFLISRVLACVLFLMLPAGSGMAAETQTVIGLSDGVGGLSLEAQLSTPHAGTDVNHYQPAMVYNPVLKEYVVVWHNNPVNGSSIEARRVGLHGELKNPQDQILISSAASVYQPDIAYNALNNTYLLVYMKAETALNYAIYGRMYNANLAPLGAEYKIYSYTNRSFWTPSVVWNSKFNEFMVVWSAFDTSSGSLVPYDVVLSILDGNGDPVWVAVLSSTGKPREVDLAYRPNSDEYLMVWTVTGSSPGNSDIVAARVDGELGQIISPPGIINVSNASEDERSPRVVTNGIDRYLVTWERTATTACCDWDIYGQEIGFDGKAQGNKHLIAGTSEDELNAVPLAWPGQQREFLVTYMKESDNGTSIWSSFNHNDTNTIDMGTYGRLWLDNFPVAQYAFWKMDMPVTASGGSEALIVYEGDTDSDHSVYRHIFARTFTPYRTFLPRTVR